MKYWMMFLCLALVFIAACDKREGEKPILTVVYSTQPLYNVANHDTISISCQLSGSNNLIGNQKINVIYNSDDGLFVGDGADNFLMTNSVGYAQGFFKVHDDFYGDVLLKFSPDHFPTQFKAIVLQVQDMPRIHMVTASDSTLAANDPTSIITVAVTSRTHNIKDRWVHFIAPVGTSMEFTTVKTDTLGIVHNEFRRNNFVGDALISTFLEIYEEDVHYITVHCQ